VAGRAAAGPCPPPPPALVPLMFVLKDACIVVRFATRLPFQLAVQSAQQPSVS
jgi:hypothetical protein